MSISETADSEDDEDEEDEVDRLTDGTVDADVDGVEG